MVSREELQVWLDSLPKGALVGVDEGGLALVVWPSREAGEGEYFEIGGMPEGE